MSWSTVRVQDIAVAHYGKALKKEHRDERGSYSVFGSSGQVGKHSERVVDFPTLIIGRKGSVGEVVWAPDGGWVIDTAFYLQLHDQEIIDLRYLFYALKRANLAEKTITTSIPGLNRDDLYSTRIPLPPLPEQKRIAAILDKADAIRRKRQQAIQLADDFLRAVFLDMFGDPVTNPKGWPRAALPDVAEKFTDGPFGSNLKSSHYVEEGVRVIRLQNIGVGSLLDDDLAFISEEHYQSLPRNHCQPGDVIVGTLGDPNLRACIIPEGLSAALNKADCLLFRPSDDKVLAEYICWLLNNPSLVESAAGLVRGQTRGRISLGRLKELEIPIPSLSEQERFRSVVRKLLDVQVKINSSCGGFSDAFSSLSQKAFSGQL
ncbi:restriction endonuclease subunit S [Alcanivorax quisquiliarum]|uniref:Restriction endonuclease subunit S n=1 Tax=Alcanivorax quisquiliarum TaxID=2933565 RepID=A0ABT0E4R2_9GAMM|nr:restriction endonuclease subunit S [Alcanivorax quisquiliarum]